MFIWNKQNKNVLLKQIALFMPALLIMITCASQAKAEPRAVDTFAINTPSNIKPSNIKVDDNTTITKWFEKFEETRKPFRPSEKDKVILTRPLTQDAARVQQWLNTASKISKNYNAAARAIRALPVPPGFTDVKEYRDLVADWFQDSAEVYYDLIRPRPPAKTIEDLQEQLDAVKKRAEGLGTTMAKLKNMDREIRAAHKVPLNNNGDAVQKFANGK